MKQTFLPAAVLAVVFSILLYFGGAALLIGASVLGGVTVILLTFFLGMQVAHRLITTGADIAIRSADRNDTHDAKKIAALAGLARESVRIKTEATGSPVSNSVINGYPALPALPAFTVSGLDEEDR
jgi:hypothetical protein